MRGFRAVRHPLSLSHPHNAGDTHRGIVAVASRAEGYIQSSCRHSLLPAASRSASPCRSTACPPPRGTPPQPAAGARRHLAGAQAGPPPQVLGSQTQRWGFLLLQGKKLHGDRSSQKARHTNPRVSGPPRKQRPQEQQREQRPARGQGRTRAEGCLRPNGQGGSALAPRKERGRDCAAATDPVPWPASHSPAWKRARPRPHAQPSGTPTRPS